MTKTFAELEAVATACMESNDPNIEERHRGAGACARAAEAAEHPSARRFRRSGEAGALIQALELLEANGEIDKGGELTTAELLLAAAMIAARANEEELPAQPTRVLVALEGGIIQGTVADRPGVEIVQLDYDTEGADAEDLFAIPQSDGSTAEAWRSEHTPTIDPAFIDGARAARPSDPEARLAMLRRVVAGFTEAGTGSAWELETRRELEELEQLEAA